MDLATRSPPDARPTVLYVDDEEFLIYALKRLLRNEPYRFICTSSTEEALRWIVSETPALVISDYRMEPTTGLAFIEMARAIQPDCQYVIHSGFADEGPIREALEKKVLNCFIPKPWDPKNIKSDILALLKAQAPKSGASPATPPLL